MAKAKVVAMEEARARAQAAADALGASSFTSAIDELSHEIDERYRRLATPLAPDYATCRPFVRWP